MILDTLAYGADARPAADQFDLLEERPRAEPSSGWSGPMRGPR